MRFSEAEIVKRLTEAAAAAGCKLTYSHKMFFLRLLDFAEQDSQGYYVQRTVSDIAKVCRLAERTVSDSLKQLAAAGAVRTETRGKPSLRRIDDSFIEGRDE